MGIHGEVSSDRQTLKMNDFLKQIEAYSNDKLDRIMPQNQVQNIQMNNLLAQQVKVAEQVNSMINRELNQGVKSPSRTNQSKKAYSDMHAEDEN